MRRPKPEGRMVTVTSRLPVELDNIVSQIAQANRRTRSDVIRAMVTARLVATGLAKASPEMPL